jgi:hypothetical protein
MRIIDTCMPGLYWTAPVSVPYSVAHCADCLKHGRIKAREQSLIAAYLDETGTRIPLRVILPLLQVTDGFQEAFKR